LFGWLADKLHESLEDFVIAAQKASPDACDGAAYGSCFFNPVACDRAKMRLVIENTGVALLASEGSLKLAIFHMIRDNRG